MNQSYSNREIDRMHDNIFSALCRIEKQTVETNGRVSWLEKMMYMAIGALFFVTPLLTWLLVDYVAFQEQYSKEVRSAVVETISNYQFEVVE